MPEAECYFLEINGANSSADLYVNGTCLVHHDGGYSAWRADITGVISEENEIVILVDNAADETVYPQTADFTFYGRLYRDVNIIGVSKTHFTLDNFGGTGIYVTPVTEGTSAKVTVRTEAYL